MRLVQVLLVLLMVAAALPTGSAQPAPAAPAAMELLTDRVGDLQATVAGTPAGNPGGRFAASDLTALSVQEAKDDLTFQLSVASLTASPEGPMVENSLYTVDFAYGDLVYRVQFYRRVSDHAEYSARAFVYDDGRDAFAPMETLVVSADPSTHTLSATLPRAILLDRNGATPFPGKALGAFVARSSSISTSWLNNVDFGPAGGQQVPPTAVMDEMPDTGVGMVDFPIQLGLVQAGNAQLSSDIPARASNGEANTFVFTVNATNLGPKQRFHLETQGVPASWQVDLPSDLLEVPGESSVTFPVLVSTPFGHQHGAFQGFTVTMTGAETPADVGRIQLGIRYTATPQPAGHHDTLYLHTFMPEGDPTTTQLFTTLFGFDPANLYFNTLPPAEDENDAEVPVGGSPIGFTQTVPPQQRYTWIVPLSPALAMGLDFDLARQGVLKLGIDTTLPMQGAQLSGRIVHTVPLDDRRCDRDLRRGDDDCSYDDYFFGPGEHATAALIGPSGTVDIGANAKGTPFELPIVATPAGDYLPFHPDATLAIQLNMTFLRADGWFGPKDLPKVTGGEMVLPLIEYHDPVDQVFSSLSSLMITVQGEQQRMVNPGKTAVYDLALMNHGTRDATYDLELSGSSLAWAQILGERRVSVPAGETRQLGIAVTAPAGAGDGEVADLVLAAIDAADPSARTLARLLTTVDTEAEHPDDSARVPGLQEQLSAKQSPGLPLAALLAALAVLGVALRRRR